MASTSIPLVELQPQSELNTENAPSSNATNLTVHETPASDLLSPTPTDIASTSTTPENSSIGASGTTLPAPTPSTTITTPSPQQSISPLPATDQNQLHIPSANLSGDPDPPSHSIRNRRSCASFAFYWLQPLVAIIVYGVTLGITFSAGKPRTLLGAVNDSWGIWVLVIVAKAGDLYFAYALADAFDCVAWGKLKTAGRDDSGRSLGRRPREFLALISSTGVIALGCIVWTDMVTLWRERRKWTTIESTARTRCRERWKHWRSARWSIGRLFCLMVMIPGPGIILVGDVKQKEVYFDERDMLVSGGLGLYNPDLATLFKTPAGPDIARFAQIMLQDPAISKEVDPVDSDCKKSKTCKSYLLAGPYRTVQPWPFTLESEKLGAFRLHNAPFYQVDMWSVEGEPELIFNATSECILYGGFEPRTDYSLNFCMRQHSQDVIVAGWKTCREGYRNSTNECLQPYSAPGGESGWTTYVHFYRRNATITFSRTQFTILEVKKLGEPQSQTIPARSLFTATNAMLYQPNRPTNDFRYDRNSQPYVLTQVIGYDLWLSTQERMSGLPIGKVWLRNILVLPVFLFQPTLIATSENLPVFYQEDGKTPLLNLPDENYVRGSYCVVDKRAIPGKETVIAYAGVAGALILFIVVTKLRVYWWPVVETSEFPLLDYEIRTMIMDESGRAVSLRDRVGTQFGNRRLMNELHGLRIGLRNA
ncbi:hypothetical protein FB567DRAFT_583288 [Paraphoma chrysanthemicola]|uniref:Transmembrane protein n=1 Tax=Paraphoma chrysanthemicola TaxID=798071 RepID=A0A8K0QXD7_9PLEO|nr:hypothetical protein FB567DRAFT_583288 [Paraphoma chrysanthemicola]